MKKSILYYTIFSWIFCFNFEVLYASTVDQQDITPISNRQMIDAIFSLSLEEQQKFCNKLNKARALIDQKLTSFPADEYDLNKRDNLIGILTIFTNQRNELEHLRQIEIAKIGTKKLTFENYLHFCKDITSQRGQSSFSGFRVGNDPEHILKHLGLIKRTFFGSQDYPNKVSYICSQLRGAFLQPFSVSQANLHLFALNYAELQKLTTKLEKHPNSEGAFNPTYRQIAESISQMSPEDIDSFCYAVHKAKSLVRQHLFPYRDSAISNPPSISKSELRGETILILEMFTKYPKELDKVRNFKLMKISDQPVTLERYLQLFVALNPPNYYQPWVPFMKKERWFHIEIFLEHLNLVRELQRSSPIRDNVYKFMNEFNNPLSLSPLKIFKLRQSLQNLDQLANNYRRPSFVLEEDLEKWMMENKARLLPAGAVVLSVASYMLLF